MNLIFIIGCGDIGLRVARLWQARGSTVQALARSDAAAARLSAAGITPLRGDLDIPTTLITLPLDGATVYYFAPPPPQGDTDPRMRAFVAAGLRPERVVYISTSGVYGDRDGAWVDEDTPPAPATDRARRRLDAETALRTWGRESGVKVNILRVGGIYGPGRWPLERLQAGTPVLREEECGYTNRIHADDLAAICIAVAERGGADRIYNVSDGSNGTMTQYFYAVADRFGLPRPPALTLAQARQQLSPAMLSYLTESRRMDNRRLLHELGVTLRYPDLAAGLQDV
ncbi:MAG: SDR family oxidoreductase [Thiohalomonadaceae bacterium]